MAASRNDPKIDVRRGLVLFMLFFWETFALDDAAAAAAAMFMIDVLLVSFLWCVIFS